ncbi:ER protein disulfide isomerase [Schizosaccharomyces osmophilus]|uniref:Protein disulfide-isomerase n=1 Tax=Schizosaccharomyces osmophilus TaxID=2545709 RepID=A0AAE9WDZ9_9SCHI|nr:ER protein disulfide isomerase [Schizosaccharomyces osmophilus]WBW74475.1 ER protein disulfide isomerase [Schizosaccharomyces osmophilus]
MHITKFFAAFLALAGGFYTSSADVPKVNKAGLQELLSADALFMTKFYAPWCGHCKALAPEYESAAEELEKDNISMIEVDCTEEADLCNEYNIRGYPTLTVFKNGDVSNQYSGPRRHDALVKYMKKQLQPVVQSVTKDNVETFTETSEDLAVIAFFDDEKHNATYTDVADNLQDSFAFAASSDKNLAKSLEVPFPGIVAFTKDPAQDTNKIVYEGQWQKGDIADFLGFSSIPLLDELNQMTFQRYHSSGLPLGIIFYNSTESRDELYNVFQPIAKQYQDTVRFAFLDALRYGAVAKQMNIESNWPAFVITHLDKFLKFPYPTSDLTSKNMDKFVKEYSDGKLQPKIKSQPVPESQGDLTVVVADNYNQVVMDSTKDVLVEFYAPWCGHCKNLAPTFESLAEEYADNKNVVVAKVDATENDLDVSISGFPTIMLFKANDKKNPLFYEGNRSLDDLLSFIEKHSSFKSTSETKAEDANETKETSKGSGEEEAYNEL